MSESSKNRLSAVGGMNATSTTTPSITQPADLQTAELASRAGFLSLFILIAFIGNIVLIATIVQSRSLRQVRMNKLILSLSFVNMLNCVLNMPLVLGYTITDTWDYGDVLCRINSCFMNMFSITMIMGISVMSLDRMIAVMNPSQYDRIMAVWKCNVLIVYTWLQAAAFSLPLISTAIESVPFPSRYLCSIKPGSTIVYPVITSIVCFLIPCIAILVSIGVVIRIALREKSTHNRMAKDHRYTDMLINETREWKEVKRSRYVVTLFVIWSILEGPYHLYTHIEQCYTSAEIQGNTGGASSLFAADSVTKSAVEISLTWMKFSNAMVLPFATFFWRKSTWQKFKDLVLCRKSNLIVDAGNRNNNVEKPKSKEEYREKKSVFKVPVLFATSRGIHVKKYDEANGENQELSDSQESQYFYADMTTKSNDIKILKKGKKNGTQSVNTLDVDTSDYDSNVEDEVQDPFSVSDPSVIKTKRQNSNDQEQVVHTRSKSDTSASINSSLGKSVRTPRNITADVSGDIHTPRKKDRKRNSSQPDLGLESNFNSTEKGAKRHRKKSSDIAPAVEDENNLNEGGEAEHKVDSNDSGRGSVKEIGKKKKKRRRISTVDTEEKDVDIPSNQTTPRETITESEEIPAEGTDKPIKTKVKKKRKPKSQSDETVNHIEMTETHKSDPTEDGDNDNAVSRRHPPRLKPIEHKGVRTNKTSPIPPLRSAHVSEITAVPQDPPLSENSEQKLAKRRTRNRTNSGPKDPEQKVVANNQVSTEENVKRERRRRSTADSQTPLMNSGSSVDLRDMKSTSGVDSQKTRRKKRTRGENKTDPGTDFDSTQSPR